uniref:Lipid scramblase CLPTM1L n=1 Tax=Periophthalmus magnuspinnatus TaxID=409849 RepID=A0A3B4BDF0_9GOBI
MVPKPPEISLIAGEDQTQVNQCGTTGTSASSDHPVAHWRSRLTFNIVGDHFIFDREYLPSDVHRYLRKMVYLPLLFVDELSNRVKDLMEINSTSAELPLTLTYDSISLGRLRFWIHMQDAVYSLQQFGFTEKDADEIKGIFVDTNLYFLALTFFVAAFHLLFDFLAFKNDISFWKQKKSMVGMSSKVWKVKKAFKIQVCWKGAKPTFLFGKLDESEKRTEEYDTLAMKYLSYLLYPLCIGGAVYALVFLRYKSWYSWVINSLVNGVYAFGFLFMLPQLFVNYKLKSVAHLPWKAFMYKAFNTFIDDVFAFIITMPTSHRLACFRDDVVFLIYLYQRWLYPVDKTRVNEYGVSYDEEPKRKSHKD